MSENKRPEAIDYEVKACREVLRRRQQSLVTRNYARGFLGVHDANWLREFDAAPYDIAPTGSAA